MFRSLLKTIHRRIGYLKNLEDDYQILSVLGQGSTSRVFVGIDVRDRHKVTIKLFKSIPEEKIRREVSILRDVKDCENVIHLEQVIQNEGSKNYGFIFTHYPGVILSQCIQGITLPTIKSYIKDILKALSYIHAKNIMHRDIKPSNILVCATTDGSIPRCRLMDFGLAERYAPGQTYKHSIGTKCYKPPEILLKRNIYTPKIDIWSLGVVLTEMLYQTKPLFPYLTDQLANVRQVLKKCGPSYEYMSVEEQEIIGRVKPEKMTKKPICAKGAILAQKMMSFQAEMRPSAAQLLRDPFFNE